MLLGKDISRLRTVKRSAFLQLHCSKCYTITAMQSNSISTANKRFIFIVNSPFFDSA